MYGPRRKIFWFAVTSRITVLSLQFIFNILCPDHYADAFRSPRDKSERVSVYDNIITLLFNGLTRWDGQYFIHIAKYGYTYENTLAFYPLYPTLIRFSAACIRKVFYSLNVNSSIITAAILINGICFVKSAIIFYDLSKVVLKNTNTAYKAAVLYCINPATIFFSAIYSESLFAYLTYYSMLKSIDLDIYVAFPISLSILTRSNGMVNIGFPMYFQLRRLYNDFVTKYGKFSLSTLCQFLFKMTTLKSICLMCNTVIISTAPFVLLQIYNYIIFCVSQSNEMLIPQHILNHGTINNFELPGSSNVEWCDTMLPVAYSYVQKKYWNIGFFKYYTVKQIPNFILALPILYIMITCMIEYVIEHTKYFCTLGFVQRADKIEICAKVKKYPTEMLVFIFHGLFMTIFCIFFVHIQVSTRLLCSASPLIYWYCASTMCCASHCNEKRGCECIENMYSKWKVFFFTQKEYTWKDKLILTYFLGYAIVGCFMFSNFLPWT
nr:GPI mannosyltransferase 2 [Megalopta genalis]XP_033320850.1 GPI mannosyltransferase 2 [Megalopta genalis]XP_033320851.1 GPI mannosyltransferase 2 [Megalopta genalis]XP_033320852.1 GPI mannosyltransferase 2 [Megalopta genalis]XP_033320853.1 GPI mannosyltransferase 2 [Megalopta genalis]